MFISTNETKLIKKSEANGEGKKKKKKKREEKKRGEYTDDRVANDLKAVQL